MVGPSLRRHLVRLKHHLLPPERRIGRECVFQLRPQSTSTCTYLHVRLVVCDDTLWQTHYLSLWSNRYAHLTARRRVLGHPKEQLHHQLGLRRFPHRLCHCLSDD